MKKVFGKCVAAFLIVSLALFVSVPVFADEFDDFGSWDSFDSSSPQPAPSYNAPSYNTPAYDDIPPYTPPTYGSQPTEPAPSYNPYAMDDEIYTPTPLVDAASEGFVSVIKHKRQGDSEVQNAVIEGLQLTTEQGKTEDEVIVTCYFIFRDKPTSYFYDVNRKDKKLVFEFSDTRIGSSPIAALDQSPLKEIVIEEMQNDANKDIKGLTPEWHDVIRISFHLEHVPVFSVTNEQNIISFSYKWTSNPDNIKQYLLTDKFPLVFWASGGTLGGIGLGVLTYFLIPKKVPVINNTLPTDDLPNRSR